MSTAGGGLRRELAVCRANANPVARITDPPRRQAVLINAAIKQLEIKTVTLPH